MKSRRADLEVVGSDGASTRGRDLHLMPLETQKSGHLPAADGGPGHRIADPVAGHDQDPAHAEPSAAGADTRLELEPRTSHLCLKRTIPRCRSLSSPATRNG